MKTNYSFLIVSSFFLGVSGCQSTPTQNSTPNAPSTSIVSGVSTSPSPALTEHAQSADGSVTLDRTTVDPATLEAARNEYKRANLIQLPVDAKYNANVLQITDATIPEYQNKAFLAPRLYAYGTQQGGQVLPIKHADGTVTLSFNVAFLDGSTHQILNPSADGTTIDVPNLFTVQDPEGLKNVLSSQYAMTNGLAPLPGCPKKITVSASGTEYDATPSNLARGDFCQLNVPITVSLTLPEDEAELMMEVELYAHLVDLEGVYETKVSYPTSKVSVTFDRAKIYSDLQAQLGVKAYYVDADVKVATTKVMQNQMMQITVQGETSEFVDQLIDKVTAEFFEPWVATPDSPSNPCGPTTPVCLRFSQTNQNQSSKMQFDWNESSNLMTGQNYITSTKLKATPNIARIGDATLNCVTSADHICDLPLSNHADARETGLTVVAGNQVTVEPDYIIRERRDQGIQKPVRTDNLICVQSHHGCQEGNGSDFAVSCGQVCDQSVDHWTDTTTYFVEDQAPEAISEPVGQIEELFDGLEFRFAWMDQQSGKMKSLDCPLADFPREGNGRTLVVRVQNVPTCSPFTGVLGETPMLYLLNRISYQETYQAGKRVVNWDGSVSATPTTQSFSPEVSFGGTVSIQGYAFESDTSK